MENLSPLSSSVAQEECLRKCPREERLKELGLLILIHGEKKGVDYFNSHLLVSKGILLMCFKHQLLPVEDRT